jgi:hypothetical protein
MTSDQFWSFFSMPIGLLICFAPIVIAWLSAGPDPAAEKDPKKRD